MSLAACALWPTVQAQEDGLPAPVLRSSPALGETISPDVRPELPVFVEGDRISGRSELETLIEGDATLRRGDTLIRAERIEYDQAEDLARARGDVRINRAGDVFEGPQLEMHVDAFEGFFTEPTYRLRSTEGYGQASRIDFLGPDRALVRQGTYTTCEREPGSSWPLGWLLTADRLYIDNESETGLALGATVRFLGVPLLPIPVLSFPLTDKRKSGVLTPTLAVNNRSGVELTVPYYWDIAPNRDATFSPTLMSRRGLQLSGEFRYLEPLYSGTTGLSYLPGDNLRGRDRWAYNVRHAQVLPAGVGLSLNLNRVSDDDYWRDFTRSPAIASLTPRLLASDAVLSWGRGNFAAHARTLRWQTLQDVTAPIVPPYDRLPQLQGRYTNLELLGGFSSYVEADYTRFSAEPALTRQPNGERAYVMAQFARPWQAPGWFVIPRVQLHATQYQFDAPLANGLTSAERSVPTFSLDTGLLFDRQVSLFGRPLVQTLEPRAFYAYTPFREQNYLPNYDSGQHDFNFATIFTENPYVGHDRIADTNLLTLGLTSRLQDVATGGELARFGLAQRLRYEDQRVTLGGAPPIADRFSDILLGASVNWSPTWASEATVQYNPRTDRSERATIGARYNPGPFRTVSAAYRTQRLLSEQVDLAWQWPLQDLWAGRGNGNGRWYSVGRLNFSLKDRELVDTIVGVEYDGCCWVGRLVFERLQTGSAGPNKRLLFQIELLGLSRVGTNAVTLLRDNIPRYQLLRSLPGTPRSRFTEYD
ncbi:LPS-assembly protein LptD [Ramlibacter sp. AW1]|uniref:LPS-assembly protein LptD n=2 Tax=Ramlibacter aurantiacus TaxID=2801330 RepID=A0A937D261_9BURK|nr:LPS-assembly protein LptD [Ramlibacter aurantiacus]